MHIIDKNVNHTHNRQALLTLIILGKNQIIITSNTHDNDDYDYNYYVI